MQNDNINYCSEGINSAISKLIIVWELIMEKVSRKSGSFVKDMTVGNEFSLLLTFSIPMLIGNLFQQFYNMVDSVVVGKYVGADALAAVGATGSLNFLFFSMCFGLGSGIGIMVSQYFGAGDDNAVKKTIFNSIMIIASIGIFMGLVGFIFAENILHFLNTPDNIIADSTLYMRIVFVGIPAVASYNCVSAIMRSLGDSKTPLVFLIITSFMNVGLDLLLVINFGMGVAGVAYATIITQYLASIGAITFALIKNPYFKIEKSLRHFDKEITKNAYKLGLPLAAQNSLIAVSCVALQSVVNKFGSGIVAAYTATSRVEQLVQQPFSSLGMAMSAFAGQNIGAGKIERVKTSLIKGFIMIGIFSAIMLLVMLTLGDNIMRIFVSEPEVIKVGSSALKITSAFYFTLGMIYIIRGLLNGAGDAMYSMINGFSEVICRILFANTLVLIPALGKWGIWFATALTWFVTGFVSLIRYKKGKWKNSRIVS